MSKQITRVDALFLHQTGDNYLVVVRRNGERVLRGKLELKETNAGPRPLRFLVTRKGEDSPCDPGQFVELVRSATYIHISQQTLKDGRGELKEMLDGYQLEALTVRTCRRCVVNGRYSPITDDTTIKAEHEHICRDCAVQELEGELSLVDGLTQAVQERLEGLLYETGDLTRITNLLQGGLDPDLTEFDTISATTEDVELVETNTLDLRPNLKSTLTERFDTLLHVQSLAIDSGLLDGDDQLVVSTTVTGKTFVGKLAGINRMLNGDGKMLFLVPLVALANQKHEDFKKRYGHLGKVTIRVGASRVNDDGNRFDPNTDVIVGTYEGIDHALRTGKDLGDIDTVVIDEVHTLKEEERGHHLDGMIARLKHYCKPRADRREGYGGAQWIYLSMTVGNPKWLAQNPRANPVKYKDRPVPIERHAILTDGQEKPRIENRLVRQAFDSKSLEGYRGQTIIFTNSRRRCHEIARKMDYNATAYHAGLNHGQRKRVERQFANQGFAAVVTTAVLATGVDFPTSRVTFDTLAMGIEWLSVQEFSQMLGRTGRPDYHGKGVVYLLIEPDVSYHNTMEMTEDEVAFELLKGEMEEVRTVYDQSSAVEETLANIVVAGTKAKALNNRMLEELPTTHTVGKPLEWGFVNSLDPTPLSLVVTRQFLSPKEALAILDGIREGSSSYRIVADLKLDEEGRQRRRARPRDSPNPARFLATDASVTAWQR